MALTPAVVKKLVAKKVEVLVESGAGLGAHQSDGDYAAAGAQLVPAADAGRLWSDADVVVTIRPPAPSQVACMRNGALLVGSLAPLKHKDIIRAALERRVTVFAMEFIPRTTRAQSMDVLSSQANMAGYKAVLLAANYSPRMFPMMITAAGTISPAKVFVIGAGVAGLQAIATAKRLGAVVEAFDVRAVVEEQVKSLGARFVKLPLPAGDAQAAGGYARELTDDERRQQQALMSKHVIGADAVIATAAVFGKAPPLLIPSDVVKQMRAGSVLIDLAADADAGRGNCEATRPGAVITTESGAVIVGTLNLPSTLSIDASQAYANNLLAFLSEFVRDGNLQLNLEDEIQKGALIAHGGEVKNELMRKALAE